MRKIKMVLVLMLILNLVGCATWMNAINQQEDNLIVREAVDTFGYTLGLLSAADPVLRTTVESYYNDAAEFGIDMIALNEALKFLGGESIAYQVLAYKMLSLVRLIGGGVDADGNLVSLGEISPKLINIGKQAYLFGLKTGGVR